MKSLHHLLTTLAVATVCQTAFGHPIPDIPVRATFGPDGRLTVLIEVDPRCFAADPLNEPYLENAVLQTYTEAQKAALFQKTKALIDESILLHFQPAREKEPEFEMRFTTMFNLPLQWNEEKPEENSIECAETPVMVTASWTTEASDLTSYQVEATKAGKFSVKILNYIGKERQRMNVLFPGESSYVLDLDAWATAVREVTAGESAADSKVP